MASIVPLNDKVIFDLVFFSPQNLKRELLNIEGLPITILENNPIQSNPIWSDIRAGQKNGPD